MAKDDPFFFLEIILALPGRWDRAKLLTILDDLVYMFLNVTERLSVPGNVLPFCKVWSSSKSMSVPSLSSSCSVATFVFSTVLIADLSSIDITFCVVDILNCNNFLRSNRLLSHTCDAF